MSDKRQSRSYEDRHKEILEPKHTSILKSLGEDGEKVFSLKRTNTGYQFVECCDGYYGITLNEDQFKRLIQEMTDLIDAEPDA